MHTLPLVLMLLGGIAPLSPGDETGGVTFVAAAARTMQRNAEAIAFAPANAAPGAAIVIALGKAEDLGANGFRSWFDAKIAAEMGPGERVPTLFTRNEP